MQIFSGIAGPQAGMVGPFAQMDMQDVDQEPFPVREVPVSNLL